MTPTPSTRGSAGGRAVAWVAAAGALALAGCGAGDPPAKQLPRAAGGIVARVGPYRIGQASYDRVFAEEARREEPPIFPVPPRYELCIAQLNEAIKRIGLTHQPKALLRSKCEESYRALHQQALTRVIQRAWLSGAAAELGVSAPKVLSRAQTKRLSERLRDVIERRQGVFTPARIKAYYESHESFDAIPETRDLKIVRVRNLAPANRLMREIAKGRSFASTLHGLPHQPEISKHGLVLGYLHGDFREAHLDHAILSAKPDVLTGPVYESSGFYIFEIKRVHPRHQLPFREVEAEVMRQLPGIVKREAVERFTQSWAKSWKGKTDCSPGYRISLCSQAEGGSPAVSLVPPG